MRRRLSSVFCGLVLFASPAWCKWDAVDKAYLTEQFRVLHEQIQALKTQVDSLNTQLADFRQNQQQAQAALAKQQRTLQEMDQIVSSLRLSQEESVSSLKAALAQLSGDQKKAFESLMGKAEAAAAPTPQGKAPAVKGYITEVTGDNVSVDVGSARGLQIGSHLAVYKASDPSTRVGVLEVQQVIDAGNSRARIVTMNPGLRPEFGDIVHLE